MKKVIVGAIILVAAIFGGIFTVRSLQWIGTGRVGVVYSMRGGVRDETLGQGVHFINPFLKVKEFTIGNEQLILSQDSRDGSPDDDSFKVATSDDARIAISFQMSYHYVPETVVDTYKRFKGMSGEDIVEQRVKTVLKSKVSEVTTDYSLMDIYSGNRSEINSKITEYLNNEFMTMYGIEVLDASVIDVHPDEEKVKVETETKKIQAQADADVEITKAQAEAESNKLISQSITPELIQMKEAEARMKHGWVTIQGADTIVTKDESAAK